MRKILQTFLLSINFISLFSQTNVGGVISTNTVWTLSGSPYNVTNPIYIPDTVKLEIEPGVTVNGSLGNIAGTLRAIGTPLDTIFINGSFHLLNSCKDFDSLDNSGTLLSYCKINEDIYIDSCSVKISNCYINAQSVFVYFDDIVIFFENNFFKFSSGFPSIYFKSDSGVAVFKNNFVSGLYQDVFFYAPIICEDNFFDGVAIYSQPTYSQNSKTYLFCNNVFSNDLTSINIGGDYNPTDKIIISGNNFLNAIDWSLSFYCGEFLRENVIISNNNFLSYKNENGFGSPTYNIKFSGSCGNTPGNYDSLDIIGNFWDNLTIQQIDSSIYDFIDDVYVGWLANYQPTLNDSAIESDCSQYSTNTQIGENKKVVSLNISPNPTSGIFSIRTNSQISNISIYNIFGEKIYYSPFPLGRVGDGLIDISYQPSGIYFVQLNSQDKIYNQKIILQK